MTQRKTSSQVNPMLMVMAAGFILSMGLFSSCNKDANPTPTPTIAGINPNPLVPGESFSLTGTNFNLTPALDVVKFGTTAVPVTSSSATSLSLTLPTAFPVGSYSVSVTINGAKLTLPGNVDVQPVSPTITGFAPAQAAVGASLVITGTNFDPTAANDIVTFGTSVTPVPVTAATATQLTVTVPTIAAGTYTLHVAVKQNGETSAIANSSTDLTVLGAPTVTTVSVTTFNEISASSGGSITSDGGSTVTARGVCWNTTSAPTINDNLTQNGSGAGNFSSNIGKLTPGTTYHVRAYATNTIGTAYSNEVTFTTTSVIVPGSLLAFFKFNGDVLDYSGHGNDLTSSHVTFTNDRNSNSNSAASFDGSTSQATVNTDFQNTTSMSISLWFNGSATLAWSIMNTVSDNFLVYDAGYGGQNQNGFGQCSSSCDAAEHSPLASRNTWHHLVGIYDGPNKTMQVYIDDVLGGSSSIGTVVAHSVESWVVGYNSFNNIYWSGYLDNVKIYNRVITVSEVSQLFNE